MQKKKTFPFSQCALWPGKVSAAAGAKRQVAHLYRTNQPNDLIKTATQPGRFFPFFVTRGMQRERAARGPSFSKLNGKKDRTLQAATLNALCDGALGSCTSELAS